MKSNDIKFLAIIVLFVVSCVVSWNWFFRQYGQEDTVDAHKFPTVIGDWSSTELTITDEEYEILETRNAFARQYTDTAGRAVQLFIVYSQTNRKVSHPPEVCYRGSGLTLARKDPATLSIQGFRTPLETYKLRLEGDYYNQTAHYWFKVGDSFTRSYWKQQLLIALNSLFGRSASSALIRVSAVIDQSNPEQAYQATDDFVQTITPLLMEYLP